MPQSDPQKHYEYNRAWAAKNPERVRAYRKKYNDLHPDVCARWHREHPDRVREIAKNCRAKNLEVVRVRGREWAKNHPEQGHSACALRRARKLGVECERFTWLEIASRDEWTCQLCGKILFQAFRGMRISMAPHIDHVIPLAAGGAHTRANSQLLCARCNMMKGAKTGGVEFLRS